jgi:hypothetical protein
MNKAVLLTLAITLTFDIFCHVETDPQWIMYINNVIWFACGSIIAHADLSRSK